MITYASVSRQVRLVLATRNAHKVSEITSLLAGTGVMCETLDAHPQMREVVEDCPTIEGNAEKKALETARVVRTWALADDTGLEVAALDGAPGVISARWAGPGCTYDDNCKKMLREMSGILDADRAATFRTVMALAAPDGRVEHVEGRLDGSIAQIPRGSSGFGYDPIFVLSDGRTLAELTAEEKNSISHRGRALRAILPKLKALALSAAAILVISTPVCAAKTEPGQETIWDQIMASQSRKGLIQGHEYLQQKQYGRALDEIRHSLAENPKDPVAHMMMGVAQYWNGMVDESIVSYRRAIELSPDDAEPHLLLGISYAWKDDQRAAEAEFRRSTELDPTRPDGFMNLGSIRESLGDYTGALEMSRKAVDLDKKNPLYRYQLGSVYRKLGRDADAVEQFSAAVKAQPDYEDALLELGCAQEREHDLKGAMATLKKAVSIKPGDSVARMRLARLHLALGEPAKARQVMADAFHLTPEEGGAGLQLSVSFSGGKKTSTAGSDKNAPGAAAPGPEPESADPLSMFERNLRRVPLDQAAVMHMDAVFLPKPKLVKNTLGESPSSLRKALAQAAGGAPSSAPKSVRRDYPLGAGDGSSRDAQINKIMDDLRQVMKDAPPDADVRLGMNLTFTHLVDIGRSNADPERRPKVTYEPRQVGNDMGLWVIGTSWMALVAEVLPEPGELPAQTDVDSWTALGLAHATVGESQRAMEAFMIATRMDPRSVPAWLGRGVAAAMSGDEDGAVAALRKALGIDPKNKAAADGLKWLLRPANKETSKK